MGKSKNPFATGLFCSTLLTSLFWGILAQFDPLGVKTAADLHSESVFMRLVGGPWYQSEAQDKITVVLIDDQFIEQVGDHWPMSYLQQELLLSDILAYSPQAVFLDFLYRHKHGPDAEVQQLVDTIHQSQTGSATSATVPIFIPYLVKDVEGLSSCDPGENKQQYSAESLVLKGSVIKEMRDSGAKETFIGWTGCGSRYPGFILQDEGLITPAFALFQSSCVNSSNSSKGCLDIRSYDFNAFTEPMMVRWGSGVSREHQSALDKAGIVCTAINKNSLLSKLKYLGSQMKRTFGQSLSSTTERGKAERCTYTDTVHATWFLGVSPEIHTYMKEMIEDRIVLIGTQIEGVHDNVISPVNGKVPGVYLFAMALDNYLEYGADYFKEMSDLAAAVIEISVLFGITFFIGFVWQHVPLHFKTVGKDASFVGTISKSFIIVVVYKIIVPVALSLLFALVMWKFRFAPMDWVGVSLLSFIANPIKLKNCVKGDGELEPDDGVLNPCNFLRKKTEKVRCSDET